MKLNHVANTAFEPLWLRVYRPVLQKILQGELLPGATLSENQLADEYQVSRTPVREAMRLLMNDGLLTIAPGRKMHVTLPSTKDIHEVYDIRHLIECEALRRLTQHSNVDAVADRMERCCDDSDRAFERRDIGALAEANERFHECMIDSLENQRLQDQFHAMHKLISMYRIQTLQNDIWAETGNQDHRRLAQFVRARDMHHGLTLLDAHIKGAEATLLSRLPVIGKEADRFQ